MTALAFIAEDVLEVVPAENLAALIRATTDERSSGQPTTRAECALSLLEHAQRDATPERPASLAGLAPGEADVIAQAVLEVLPTSLLETLHRRMVRRLDRRFPVAHRHDAGEACRLLRRAAKEAELQCR